MVDQNKQKRQSGLLAPVSSGMYDLDLSSYLKPYLDFQQEYENFIQERKVKEFGVAYKVTFTDIEGLLYIAFAKNKDKAKSEAIRYFREFHPNFLGTGWMTEFKNSRSKRIPALDKFAPQKVVPIPDLLEIGATFPCSVCKHDNFSLKDYEAHRCFIVEDEGNDNPFTKGYILCYDCFKKYMK